MWSQSYNPQSLRVSTAFRMWQAAEENGDDGMHDGTCTTFFKGLIGLLSTCGAIICVLIIARCSSEDGKFRRP